MLDGIRSSPIVVGAYTDGRGGVCPMLAAHRRGGRTSFISFAKAWDAFARTKVVRRATERELRTLEHLLEASLADEARTDLGAAIAEYRASTGGILARRLKPGRLRLGQRPGEVERTPSLRRANASSGIAS